MLIAYNQERYIRDAIEGAFAQTYSPLEIIISDDCSSDSTFEIIQDMARSYSGPHRVKTNRNKRNLGLGGHINHIMKKASGDLIVVAAGDDVSINKRVQRLADVWIAHGCAASSLCSDAVIVDSDGSETGKLSGKPFEGSIGDGLRRYFNGLQGPTHAWTKEVFDVFGDLLPGTVCEDRVIPLRSCLLKGVVYVPESLVKYRRHGRNITSNSVGNDAEIVDRTADIYSRNINIYENYMKDLKIAHDSGLLNEVRCEQLIGDVLKNKALLDDKVSFLCGNILEKIHLIITRFLNNPRQSIKWIIILLLPKAYIRHQKRNLRE